MELVLANWLGPVERTRRENRGVAVLPPLFRFPPCVVLAFSKMFRDYRNAAGRTATRAPDRTGAGRPLPSPRPSPARLVAVRASDSFSFSFLLPGDEVLLHFSSLEARVGLLVLLFPFLSLFSPHQSSL